MRRRNRRTPMSDNLLDASSRWSSSRTRLILVLLMRCIIRPVLLTILALFSLQVSQPAVLACTLTIATYDSTRSIRPFLGPSPTFGDVDFFSNVRAALQTHFGPDLTFAPAISDARGSALAGANVLIMTEVQPLLSPADAAAEAQAIADFVRNGGCLVIQTDTLEQSFPNALNNVNGAGRWQRRVGQPGRRPLLDRRRQSRLSARPRLESWRRAERHCRRVH